MYRKPPKLVEEHLLALGYRPYHKRWKGSLENYFWKLYIKRRLFYRVEVMASTFQWTISRFKEMPVIQLTDKTLIDI